MSRGKGSDSAVTIAHFDSIAERYGPLYDEETPVGYSFVTRRQRVLDLLDPGVGKVLDVGCGPGVMVDSVTGRGSTLVGVDPSFRMIQSARDEHLSSIGAYFGVGAAEQLCFPDQSFDSVICMGVLERLADDVAALREMVRVLKVGGNLIVSMPNQHSPYLAWRDGVFYPSVAVLRPLGRRMRRSGEQQVVRGYRRYTLRGYVARLENLGSDVVGVEYCVYNTFLAPLDSVFPHLSVSLMRRAEVLHRGALRAGGAALIVKSQKREATIRQDPGAA